jgi:hypothetical protein
MDTLTRDLEFYKQFELENRPVLDHLRIDLLQARKQIELYKSEMEASKTKSEATQADHRSFREEMSAKLKASEKKCDELKSENAALNKSLSISQSQLNALKEEYEKQTFVLEQKLADANRLSNELKNEFMEAQKELECSQEMLSMRTKQWETDLACANENHQMVCSDLKERERDYEALKEASGRDKLNFEETIEGLERQLNSAEENNKLRYFLSIFIYKILHFSCFIESIKKFGSDRTTRGKYTRPK